MPDVNKGIINYGTIGGDAKVRSDTKHVGDRINTRAVNSNIKVKSELSQVDQTASRAAYGAQQQELSRLLEQLNSVLGQVPATHRDGAEAVANQAQALVQAAARQEPNKSLLQVTAEGLRAAAKMVTDVAPSIGGIVSAIVSIVGGLSAL